ncbi:Vitamin B12 transport ATP-binding protein BacA [Ensifer adhaerens]|uniref:ATP-binding cassette transporter n=1 Tax=Ensifer adhaerens TaxID=106592 RepID=A0ACC5T4Q6_ENSAD|nr:SbmA/BacA-like family transporter [Ensifer adhaerens]MBP1875899.1 putative ATP-binding cassette transporter [Ensifer adhaerens]NRP21299.1 Vitamin B12 transport ATP-binding protein BacA [Ensifer adhaerens]
METQQASLKVTAARFLRSVRILLRSEVGGRAKLTFAGLVALLFGLNGLNVVNNYVGRNFMTAIAERQTDEFVRQAVYYICVFAILTIVGVIARFTEERLALLWREFLTRRAVNLYLEEGTYYRLDISGQLAHPDQRIAEDIRAFTVTTLSYVIMLFSSALTVVSFSGVLWSISPLLFGVAVLYAASGSYMTIVLGRPLIDLNYDRLDKEANFRSSLIHVRENAESVLVTRGEDRQRTRLLHRIDDLVANIRSIIAVNRNLGFFTNGYNWMIQIIPDLIIAPAFMRGEIEFGVITQPGAAFAMLVGAFSLIIRQFNSISNFAAVVSRLSSLLEAIERTHTSDESRIELEEQKGQFAFERVTLRLPDGSPLLNDLSISIPAGSRVLVTGASPAVGVALFRAAAGIPVAGAGRIIRPGSEDLMFLPQRPYLTPGSLRQILLPPGEVSATSDARLRQVLRELGLEELAGDVEGLGKEQNREISLGDQQLLAIAKVLLSKPQFVFMDRVESMLRQDQFDRVLHLFSAKSITCVNNGERSNKRDLYDAVLECHEDGQWAWKAIRL